MNFKDNIKKIAQGALWNIFGSGGLAVVSFCLLPLWTYFLTKEEFGVYGIITAYVGFLSPFLALGLPVNVLRSGVDQLHNPNAWSDLISTLFWGSFIQVIIGGGIFYFVFSEADWFEGIDSTCMLLALITLLITIPLFILKKVLVTYEDHRKLNILTLCTTILGLVIAAYCVAGLKLGVIGRFIGPAAAAVIFLIMICRDHKVKKLIRCTFSRSQWQAAAIYGAPTIFFALGFTTLTLVDRIIVESILGLEKVGEYTVVSTFSSRFLIVVTAINTAWNPRYQKLRKEGSESNRIINKYNDIWLVAMGILSMCCASGGPIIFELFTHSKYSGGLALIAPIVMSMFLVGVYNIAVAPIFYEKRTKVLPILTIGAAIVNTVLNIICIPIFGIIAAGYATLFSVFVMVVLGVQFGGKKSEAPYEWKKLLFTSVFVVIVCCFGGVWGESYSVSFSLFYWLICAGIYCLFSKVALGINLLSILGNAYAEIKAKKS